MNKKKCLIKSKVESALSIFIMHHGAEFFSPPEGELETSFSSFQHMSDQPSPKRHRSEEPEDPSITQQPVEEENDDGYTQEDLDKGFELIKAVIAGDLVGTTSLFP